MKMVDLRASDVANPNCSVAVTRISRRAFVIAAGGFGVTLLLGKNEAAKALEPESSYRPSSWITISPDGTTTIVSPASEMGQGVMTSLPLLIAEEMDADWSKIRIVQAPADAATFGNPAMGGLQLTGGSRTTQGYFERLRLVGAQARKVLLQSASEALKVPVDELTTDVHAVRHKKTGRRIGFGDLAKRGSPSGKVTAATLADLKRPEDWRYIGKPLPRIEIASKVNGTAKYGIDHRLPGMLYASVLRPPVQGEHPLSVDDTAATAIAGVVKVVQLPYGVGVIAETVEASQRAKGALKVKWSAESTARTYTSQEILADYSTIAADLEKPAVEFAKEGDARSAIASATKTMSTIYMSDHVHHATMEPMNATALVSGDRAEIWGSIQAQTAVQHVAAEAIGTTPDKIAVNTLLLGGGLGRRSEVDFVMDAVLLAKALPGRPVKVIWSREDDVRNGKYRPLTAQMVQVGLDAHGKIVGWRQRVVAESVFARYFPPALEKAGGFDEVVASGVESAYKMPALLGEYQREPRGVDVGFWRAVGPGYTKFALECMIDEAAGATGVDPIDARIKLLEGEPRAQRVLTTVAEMAQWTKKRERTGLGVAYSDAFGSHCAQVAEVELDRKSGEIRVVTVWCAVDPGVVIQPLNVEAQMMGGIIHGISHALYEQINVVNGVVQETNFDTYRVLRMSETPKIQIRILSSPDSKPGGIGEVGLPPIGPAIANAVAAITGGVRLRHYPFLAQRVAAALKA